MYAAGYGIKKLRATRTGGHAPRVRRAALVAAALLLAGAGFAVVAHGSPPARTTVVVQAGDTLWSIAAEHYPSDDVRVRIQDIERANGLSSPDIGVGQTLVLPG